MTNPDSLPSQTAEEDIAAQFTDRTGSRTQVRVGLNGYTLMTTREEMWREATIGASTDGAVQFRAFGSMSDGTVAAHVESRGRTQRVADLRIEPDGQWSSRIDDRTARGSQIRTEARGLLRHPDLPVRLRRTRIAADGTLSWTADAEMRRNVTTVDGLHALRTTSGIVHYSGGGTGTFTTTVLVATVDSIGTENNAGAEWKPIQTDPGFRGFVHVVNHPNGSSDVTVEITEISTGTRSVTNKFDQDTPATPGHGQGHVHEVTETVFPGGGGSPSSTKTSETVNPDGSWEKTTTGVGGDTTVERGVEERGSEGTQSVTTSTVHGDGSVTLTTTTWGSDMRGTSHTTEVNPAGTVVEDEGAKTGTVDLANSTFRRPGDLAPIFTPDPPPPSDAGQPSSSGGQPPGGEGQPPGGGGQPPSGDGQPPSGDGQPPSGDGQPPSGDGQPPSGEGQPPSGGGEQGGDGDPHGGGGEQASDDGTDGGFGDDTSGHPGLGWDGENDGPLGLLPKFGASVVGGYDDPGHDLDSLGDGQRIGEILAKAFRDVVTRGGTGSEQGQGHDTGDPEHGLSAVQLLQAATSVVPPDPEWGDWTNPKAHATYADGFAEALHQNAATVNTAGFGSGVNSFLPG